MEEAHELKETEPIDEIEATLLGLARLSLPGPPMLAEAMGYDRDERYVAFFWGSACAGDDLRYDDGFVSAACPFMAWRMWTEHVTIYPALINYKFMPEPFDDESEIDCLLIDRATNTLFVGKRPAVLRFVRNSVKDRLPLLASVEDINGEIITADPDDAEAMGRFLAACNRRLRAALAGPTPDEQRKRAEAIARNVTRELELCNLLRAWLDNNTTPEAVELYKAALAAQFEDLLAGIGKVSDGSDDN